MVSTRHHPREFPPPSTPAKTPLGSLFKTPSNGSSTASSRQSSTTTTTRSTRRGLWTHTISYPTLIWLVISVPVVLMDASYIFLRPASMPGGSLHSTFFPLYSIYASVDYMYGFPALERGDGFPAAQSIGNIIECIGYLAYLTLVYWEGKKITTTTRATKGSKSLLQKWVPKDFAKRKLKGNAAIAAVLLGYSTALLTLGKTVLYWLNEYCAGFANIGHNDPFSLVVWFIIPNGLWIAFPAYLFLVFGTELTQGLVMAAGSANTPFGKRLVGRDD